MKKYLSKGLGFLVLGSLFLGATPALAIPSWDVSGITGININYLATDYLHNVTFSEDTNTGVVTGSGTSAPYAWTVTSGLVNGNNFTLSADYTATPDAVTPLTTMTLTGTISAGLVSGTWNDNYNGGSRSGTFTTASGTASAVLLPQTITVDTSAPSSAVYGSTFPVAATSDSSLPVDITVTGGCSIAAGVVTMESGVTDCDVHYNQAGNGTYSAATEVVEPVNAEKFELTVSGVTASNKVYDGNNSATVDASLAVLVETPVVGDDVTLDISTPSGTFADKHVGNNKTVTFSGLTLTGADAANYNLTQPTATANITPLAVTVTASFNSKQYDSNTSSVAIPTLSALLVGGDTAVLTQVYSDKNVGTANKTVIPTAVITDGNPIPGANYAVTLVNNTVSTITTKVLNVTPSASDKVYNGNTVATVSFADDRISGDIFTISGTAQFANKNVGTGKVVQLLTINKTGTDAGNYTMNVSGAILLADINVLPITVTAQLGSKIYDGLLTSGLTPTFAPVLAAGDSFTTLSQAYLNKDVGIGNKVIAPTAVINDGNGGLNYAITLVNNNVSTISAKALALVGTTVTPKVYDKTDPATLNFGGASLVGLVSPDTSATVTFSGGIGVYNNSNAGTGKPVTVTGVTLGGSGAGNYTLTQPTGVTGNITRRPISVTATFNSKTYDRLLTSVAIPTITSGTLVGGDTAVLTQAYTNKNVGTANKTVVPTTVITDGNSGNNYLVTPVNNTVSTITPRALAVTATGVNKMYDGTVLATVTFSDDRVLGDVFNPITGVATFADKHVGTNKPVSVTGISVTGTDAGNYTANTTTSTTANITVRPITVTAVTNTKVYNTTTAAAALPVISVNTIATGDTAITSETYDNPNVAGSPNKVLTPAIVITDGNLGANYAVTLVPSSTGIITTAPVTVAFTANPKVYDGNTSATINTRTVTGHIAPDGVITATGGTATFNNENVGTRTVNASGFSLSNPNYAVTSVTPTTANITVRTLAVTANAADKVYDATTGTTTTFTDNRVGGDVFTVTGVANFVDKNVGNNKTVNVTGISISGTDAGNYTQNTTTTDTADIDPVALLISASAQNKQFDGNTTATVTLANDAFLGDVVTQTYTTADFDTASVGVGKTVTVNGITTAGADAGNYTANTSAVTTADITEQPSSGGSGGSRPRPRTVTGTTGTVLGAEKFTFTLLMKQGSVGNEVMELQKFLNANGFGTLVVDGKFGPMTRAAVVKFQLANGLVGDGVVGPLTRAVLNK